MDKISQLNSELCVFVYGTLKPGGRYHRRYCQPHLTEAVPAQVQGQLYDFAQLGYPGMTTGEDWVKGYVLRFAQPRAVQAQILHRLDALEGYSPGTADERNDYVRCKVQAFSLEQVPLQTVWGYVMSVGKVRSLQGLYLPNGEWPVILRE